MVSLDQDNVELFRIFWPPDPLLVQARPGVALVVMTRSAAGGGFLVAMPAALCLPRSLPVIQDEAGVIGPHKRMEVPGVRMVEDGLESLGIDLDVQLVDLSVGALGAILPLSQVAESEDQGLVGFGQDLDVIPDPTILVAMASEWLSGQAMPRVAFYSAEEEPGVEALPLPSQQAELPGQPDGITPPVTPQPHRSKVAPKPKRVTTAALSEQLGELMTLLPTMSNQIAELRKDQDMLRSTVEHQQSVPPVRPTQLPVSGAMQAQGSVSHFAKMMGSPPRTRPAGAHAPAQTAMNASGADAALKWRRRAAPCPQILLQGQC